MSPEPETKHNDMSNTLAKWEIRPFTKRQNFRLAKIESSCRQQNKHDSKIKIFSWIDGEYCGYQHFLLYPECDKELMHHFDAL